jgi:NTP pyrophosphatase (non-canonical NTP hydrolase)
VIDDNKREKVSNELADVFIYLTYISNHFDINLEEAVKSKIKLNGLKYPVEKSFGNRKKYNEL